MDSYRSQGHKHKVKHNQSFLGFELGSIISFSQAITVTLSTPPCFFVFCLVGFFACLVFLGGCYFCHFVEYLNFST